MSYANPNFIEHKTLSIELSWLLLNLGTSERQDILKLVENGIIDVLVFLLSAGCQDTAFNTMWAISNISLEDTIYQY